MAEIITSKDPGHYPTGQSVTITFPAGTRKAIITRDDRPPVLTEILAYDTGPIPPGTTPEQRPFLAVTQDGKGNVVYDGGFPKFYNMQMCTAFATDGGGNIVTMDFPPTRPNTRPALTAASQYLLNELSFIASPKKVGLGNRKILFVNNTYRSEIYNVKASHYTPDPGTPASNNNVAYGFRDTFDAVCTVGNWIPTYYDCTDASGQINLSTEYLDQFAAVVFVASYGGSTKANSRITDQFAANIAQYRRFGNGVAIITDHCGGNYTSVQDALDNGSVFGYDATKVAQYYSAYFSGNVDRSPISVGTIRAQIGGDHPLFAGMSDSEMIFAGGSESLTFPEDDSAYEVPTTPYTVNFNTAGTYRINVLVQLDDGTIITRNLRYIIISPSDINMVDTFNRGPGAGGITTYKQAVDYSLLVNNIDASLYGKIVIDNSIVGWFTTAKVGNNWVTSYAPLAGPGAPIIIYSGKRLRFIVQDPFEYEINALVTIPDPTPYYAASGSVSTFIAKVMSHPYYTGLTTKQMATDITAFTSKYFPAATALGANVYGQWWEIIGKGRLGFAPLNDVIAPVRVKIYADINAWNAAKPTIGSVGDAIIVADTNAVYYWDDPSISWILHPNDASGLFGLARKAVNLLDQTNWIIQRFTTVPI